MGQKKITRSRTFYSLATEKGVSRFSNHFTHKNLLPMILLILWIYAAVYSDPYNCTLYKNANMYNDAIRPIRIENHKADSACSCDTYIHSDWCSRSSSRAFLSFLKPGMYRSLPILLLKTPQHWLSIILIHHLYDIGTYMNLIVKMCSIDGRINIPHTWNLWFFHKCTCRVELHIWYLIMHAL